MSATGDSLRAKSEELRAGAQLLFEAADFETNRTKQSGAIIGMTASHVYEAMGQLADGMVSETKTNKLSEAVRESLDKNQLLRLAAGRGAASGDWSDFDRLVRDISEPAGPRPPVAPSPNES